jgi:hypothetical protein
MSKKHWQQHLESALLGTIRAAWSPLALPAPVRDNLPAATGDVVHTFLDATALLYAYTKAGTRATAQAETPLPEAPEDPLPFCNTAAVDLWRRIRALECNNPVLEMRWIELCFQSRHVLAPELLVEIFTLGAHKKMAVLRPFIALVAGERGRWLASFFSEWPYVLQQGNVQRIWAEGKPTERIDVFRNIRKNDPAAGLQLLESTWVKESAADRKRFLEILAAQVSVMDLGFLEQIREEYAQIPGGGKAAVVDIKRWITRLLLHIPESGLFSEWTMALRSYCKIPLIGKATFTLPEKEDDFFNESNLSLRSGFAKSGTGVVAINTWLHDLMNTIPPAVWVAATGVSASKTLELLGQHAEMRSALVQASINNNDDTFAEILLAFCSGEQWHALLGMLPEGRREVLIMGNAAYSERLNWAAPALQFHWSEEFSRWVLSLLYDSWIGYYFHRIQLIMPLDVYLNPAVKPANIPGLYDQAARRERWLSVIVPELEQVIAVKGLLFR